jgi:hypothetical protein
MRTSSVTGADVQEMVAHSVHGGVEELSHMFLALVLHSVDYFVKQFHIVSPACLKDLLFG